MADAMEMMILSILSPALHCDWQIDSWKQALITTVTILGCFVSTWKNEPTHNHISDQHSILIHSKRFGSVLASHKKKNCSFAIIYVTNESSDKPAQSYK